MNSGQEKKDAINILKCGAVDIDIDNDIGLCCLPNYEKYLSVV